MKKTILSVAVMLTGMLTFSSLAQTPEATATQTSTEQTAETCNAPCQGKHSDCDKPGKHRHNCKPGAPARHGQPKHRDFFAGIDLTPEQQSKLNDIKPLCTRDSDNCKGAECIPPQAPAPQDCSQQSCNRSQRPEGRHPEGRRPEGCNRPAHRRDNPEKRRQYIEQVKGILTPEQYVIFLENIVMPPMAPAPEAPAAPAAE